MIVDAQDPVENADADSTVEAGDAEAPARTTRRTWWRVGVALVAVAAYASAAQLSTDSIVVKPGDTLTKIAGDYRTSVAAIVAANGIENPDLIVAGRTLLIPSTTGETTHVVRMGDTVTRLATVYGTTADAIVQRNKLSDANMIRIGQTLVIPRPAGSAPAPTTSAPPTTAAPAVTVTVPAPVAPSVTVPPTTAPAAVVATTSVPPTTAPPTSAAPAPTVSPTTTPPGTIPRLGSNGGLVSTMWVVQPGDTVASIAARFGLSPRRLASANAIAETDPLLPGQRIYVPQS